MIRRHWEVSRANWTKRSAQARPNERGERFPILVLMRSFSIAGLQIAVQRGNNVDLIRAEVLGAKRICSPRST